MAEHPSLAAALAAFQAELPKLTKNAKSEIWKDGRPVRTYDYADLAELSNVCLPLLGKHGLSFSARPTLLEGQFVLNYIIRHNSGESDSGVWPLGNNMNAQQIGSALTYARRYLIGALFGPAGDADDDGQAATEAQRAPQRPAEPAAERPLSKRMADPAQLARDELRAERTRLGHSQAEVTRAWQKWHPREPLATEPDAAKIRAFVDLMKTDWALVEAGPKIPASDSEQMSFAEQVDLVRKDLGGEPVVTVDLPDTEPADGESA